MTTESRPAGSKTFGETALLTPANAITVGRLVLTPFFIWLLVAHGVVGWGQSVIGALVAFSDGIDGVVARRMGSTRSGAFLDPLIDKIVILACMVTMVCLHRMWFLPVAIIAARELWMSWYRTVESKKGISIPARPTAKVKTLLQDFAIALIVLPPTASLVWLQVATLWAAVALTLWTGWEYYRDGKAIEAAAS